MARPNMVTRTIPTTIVTVFCVNTEDRSTFEQNVTLPRIYKDEKSIMKALSKVFDGEPVKPVSVVSSEVQETYYGMLEQDFIRYAQVLPPRVAKETI